MARPKLLSDAERRLRGTYEPSRAFTTSRVRLTEPVEPPAELDATAAAEWAVHMKLCLLAGTLAVTDLRAFQALAETAALASRAYREAMAAGPIARGDNGSKVSPEWSAWGAANTKYLALLAHFGLTPASARQVPQLPPPKGAVLQEV
jgi:phage terminase small subunit